MNNISEIDDLNNFRKVPDIPYIYFTFTYDLLCTTEKINVFDFPPVGLRNIECCTCVSKY